MRVDKYLEFGKRPQFLSAMGKTVKDIIFISPQNPYVLVEEGSLDKVIVALSHGKRRALILRLGESGPMGIKDLKRELGLSTGSLYHNLFALGDLIERTRDRKYALTEQGRRVYLALKSGLVPSTTASEMPRVVEALVPVWLFTDIPNWVMLPMAALILLSLSASSLYARTGLALLIPITNVSFSSTLGSVVLSILLVYLVPRLIFQRREAEIGFLVAIPFCYIPQLAYFWLVPLCCSSDQVIALMSLLSGGISVLLLSAAIACWFKASPQAALLTSFIILYLGAAFQQVII
ncbi:MAG: hypothetical protein ACUVUS_00155 [Thermoproteota archaeon]